MENKHARITLNDHYLFHCYRLERLSGGLFTRGLSLSENGQYIADAISNRYSGVDALSMSDCAVTKPLPRGTLRRESPSAELHRASTNSHFRSHCQPLGIRSPQITARSLGGEIMGAALLKLAGLTFIAAALLTQGGDHALTVWALLFVGCITAAVVFAKLRQERDDTNEPAYRELLEISIDAHIGRARFHQWDEAQRMLRDHYTAARAAESSGSCAKRIEYLKVSEPLPAIEDFFPADSIPKRGADHRKTLAALQHRFELGCDQQRHREEVRKKELAWAKTLHDQLDLTERSRTSVAARRSDDQQSDIEIAAVAETSEQLQSLINDKPQYWVWAAFASVLVQRKNALQPLLNAHRDSVTPAPRRRMGTTDELRLLAAEVSDEVVRLAENFGLYMNSPPFQRLFSDCDLYDEPSPGVITRVAATVIDFYEANLLLARDTRRVQVDAKYAAIIEDIAHLIDGSLDTVDELITKLVGYIDMLPAVARAATNDTPQRLSLELDLDPYSESCLDRIYERLDALDSPRRR